MKTGQLNSAALHAEKIKYPALCIAQKAIYLHRNSEKIHPYGKRERWQKRHKN